MEPFQPYPGMTLSIGTRSFIVECDPSWPTDRIVWARQGAEATIYQMRESASGALWALKVFHPGFVAPQLLEETHLLNQYVGLPGLTCARRYCLTLNNAPELVVRYPALQYAILMPWMSGRLWVEAIIERDAGYSAAIALHIARMLAACLSSLEASGVAHTDVAGGNILLSPTWDRLELIDLDRMYLPGAAQPRVVSSGSPGYAFPSLDQRGQWRRDGDRFAGAIALVEMLAWSDPAVRAITPPEVETLFNVDDLQALESERWSYARGALWNICRPTLDLFDQAWNALDLAECPPLAEWARALNMYY